MSPSVSRQLICSIACLLAIRASSQSPVDARQIIGQWKFQRADITIGNKKEPDFQQDTASYVFRADSTYSLIGRDLWSKSEIRGKWRSVSRTTIQLYDIIHISEVKGERPVNSDYQLELKEVEHGPVLYLSSYDEKLEWLHELYYRRLP
jgi:hypothetical protein